jgi:membrane protease YdiL (CAAX protease family)
LLVTSALFGCMHAYQGPFRIFQTAIYGVICGAFFLWLRRTWPLALAHAISNYLVMANPARWIG